MSSWTQATSHYLRLPWKRHFRLLFEVVFCSALGTSIDVDLWVCIGKGAIKASTMDYVLIYKANISFDL